jgi:hypothetical protein
MSIVIPGKPPKSRRAFARAQKAGGATRDHLATRAADVKED